MSVSDLVWVSFSQCCQCAMEEEVGLDFYHFCRGSVWIIPWLSCSTAGKEYLPEKKIGFRPKLLGFQENCIKEGKELRGCFKPSIVETMKCRDKKTIKYG